jgi:hypothetical protein
VKFKFVVFLVGLAFFFGAVAAVTDAAIVKGTSVKSKTVQDINVAGVRNGLVSVGSWRIYVGTATRKDSLLSSA